MSARSTRLTRGHAPEPFSTANKRHVRALGRAAGVSKAADLLLPDLDIRRAAARPSASICTCCCGLCSEGGSSRRFVVTIQVFVSYRRGDSSHAAGRLVARLDEHFKLS